MLTSALCAAVDFTTWYPLEEPPIPPHRPTTLDWHDQYFPFDYGVSARCAHNYSNAQAGQLLYKSITLNGETNTLNWTYNPGSTDGWWGITINWQMDGNYQQDSYSVHLDELTFTYN